MLLFLGGISFVVDFFLGIYLGSQDLPELMMACDGAPGNFVVGGGVAMVPLGSPGAKGEGKGDGKGKGKSARNDLDGYVLVDPMGNQQKLTNKQAKQLARHRGMSLGNAPPYQPPATWDRRGGGKGGGAATRRVEKGILRAPLASGLLGRLMSPGPGFFARILHAQGASVMAR